MAINKRILVESMSDDQLLDVVVNNNYANIQRILGVSCFVWKEILRDRGLELKSRLRMSRYPELTLEQERLLIGSLLGDGGLEEGSQKCSRFFESHAPNQYLYLRKKHVLLKPFSCDIYIDRAYEDRFCYRFTTISHSHFKKLRDVFYEPFLTGKLIPVEFIKAYWHDDILAYWFLDDGHFDAKSGCYTIANRCPKPDQLYAFLEFLSSYYQASFTLYTEPDLFNVKIPLKLRDKFIGMILNVATEDVLYKVPVSYRQSIKENLYMYNTAAGSSRIDDIKSKIHLGYSLDELQKEYPITKALFLRLGGTIRKFMNMNHPIIKEIIGDGQVPAIQDPLDTDIIISNILGDGNVFKYGNDTCVFSFAHSTPQIGYVKLKYELLKSYVIRIRYLKNTTNDFYSFHVLLKSLSVFSDYYRLFYTGEKDGKRNPQKYLFREEIVDKITLKTLAFWVMDDGKKYGSGKYMFTITIGKQPYYTFKDFQRFVAMINSKLGIDLRAREEKISYELTTTSGTAGEIFDKIKDHIWPYFSYKFGVETSDCGGAYKGFPWYDSWVNTEKGLLGLKEIL